jgi:hypothetical protein
MLIRIVFTGIMMEFQRELCLGRGWVVDALMMFRAVLKQEMHSISSLKQW